MATCTFIPKRENVVLLGPPGTGKTHCETCIGAYGPSRRRDASVGAGDRD
ncbi:MAG: ATP-binding protein [Propioniciclava sp.]